MSSLEAKPTEYKGVLYRSRLEARWAVYLDNHPHIHEQVYEPGPHLVDFSYVHVDPKFNQMYLGYIQIKPSKPSTDYLQELCQTATSYNHPFLLAVGSFYQTDEPTIWILNHPGSKLSACLIGHKLSDSVIGDPYALSCAAGYRFDLAQPELPRKKGLYNASTPTRPSKKRKRRPF